MATDAITTTATTTSTTITKRLRNLWKQELEGGDEREREREQQTKNTKTHALDEHNSHRNNIFSPGITTFFQWWLGKRWKRLSYKNIDM